MDSRLTVGIDVGGTKTAAVLMSGCRTVLADTVEPTDRSAPPEQSASQCRRLIDSLLEMTHSARDALHAVGVGLPGLITPDRTFRDSIILPAWRDVDFESLLGSRLGVPVTVDNDTTMAALGHFASLRPHGRPRCLVCLTLGTGVGGAVLLDGKPLRGSDGTAGQIGHLVVEPSGRRCDCGSKGCLNAYASGTAISARYAELKAEESRPHDASAVASNIDLRTALRNGDDAAERALREAVNALTTAVSGMVNVLNPELVVLGGGVAGLGRRLTDPVQAGVSRHSFPAPARRVRVCVAAHGPLTGAVGAAVTAGMLSGTGPSDSFRLCHTVERDTR
ncbi:glucokinase [Streptomyces sp. B4I13]|uniref:ROK family protein n=1 Tax=Streptomyces sp. B4I13 TaxID=3042271 RepID=UPI00278675D6|nr:ROK family protein [Streptomyces sp. B4I13]MDQ0958875.1 glucokinase [Streptomyces sp. B4I13]